MKTFKELKLKFKNFLKKNFFATKKYFKFRTPEVILSIIRLLLLYL